MKTASIFLLLWFMLLCSSNYTASAQASTAADYYFTPRSGTYSYLSGGTAISAVEVDDGLSGSISLGFTFTYCGTDYTNIYASSNGWISFGSSPYLYAYPGSTAYLATGSTSGIGPAAMPLWDDVSGTSGSASYLTSGTAPNRVFTIEFREWLWDYSVSAPVISFQIKLFEGTNVIQYIYQDEGGTPAWDYSDGATIGIGGGSSSDYLVLDDASSAPGASSSTFTYSITTKPASGQIYEFSPYPPCSGTPTSLAPLGPAAKVCGEFTLTENTSDITTGKTYQWRSRPAGSGPFTDIPGATNSALTTTITANTDFQLYVTCTGSGLSATSATKTIEVVQPPAISTSGPASFCSNTVLTLSSTPVTGHTYRWFNVATGSIAGATAITYDPTTNGRYTLLAYTSACIAGVASTDTIDVTVKPAPDATINPAPSVTICGSENTLLSGGGTGDYQWMNSAGIISGATGTTLLTGTAGSYRLEITNTTNGCKDTSDVTTVISSPPPTVNIFPTDSVGVCTGLSAILNGLTTGTGLSYQWYDASGALSGETGPALSTPAAGSYLLVVAAGSCKDTSNTTKVFLRPLPDATVTSVGTTQVVCPMSSDMVLRAPGTAGYTYQWQTGGSDIAGATSRDYKVNTPADYVVRVTDAFGCIQHSVPFTAVGTPAAFPHISPDDLYFCEGGNLVLYANFDKYYTRYQWFKDGSILPDDTLNSYVSSVSGAYELQITDSFNCTTRSAPSVVTVNPLPKTPEITKIATQLRTGVYTTYQWYRNGKKLPGETARTYDLVFDGYYNVEVTNAIGCYNMSDTFFYSKEATNLAGTGMPELRVYPNPAKDKVYIDYPETVRVTVKDLQGKTILEHDNKETDLAQWPDGVYYLMIRDRQSRLLKTEKVIKYSR